MKQESITDYDLTVKLLGREPRTPFEIKTKCPDGTPQTLIADPIFLEDGLYKPFPTFIWLVCPRLKALVGDLEQAGMVREFTKRLRSDQDFLQIYMKGHNEMAEIRFELAKKLYQKPLPQHIEEILTNNSIAGSKDVTGVKCLHSHLAQELAFGNNPVGAEVLRIIGGACAASDICQVKTTQEATK